METKTSHIENPGSGHSHHSWFDWLRLVALVLLWGTGFALLKTAIVDIPPTTVVMGRLWIGAILLLAWMKYRGQSLPRLLPPVDKHWKWFLALGLTGASIPFALISWGQQVLPSALTAILMATMPLVTAALAHFLVPGERMGLRKLSGLLIGFAGVAILMGPQMLTQMGGPGFLAQLAVIAGAILYAVQIIIARKMPPVPASVVTCGLLLCAAIAITPFGLVAAINMPMPGIKSLLSVLALGVGATAIAGIIMMALIHDAGPGFTSLSNYLMPMVAVAVGLAIGETLGVNVWIALVVILVGLILAGYRSKVI
ncbi:Permease of the drug/metabolite transporter (DMT) superfamily [hydrothermal vent metagenome]|uniref:Permease of the drug/metabolite transporter (DMT) superfamily n=1 Tax=hydrothermal vent metagenome TaxID=652676 RepID=A0A3B0RH26_9ZZZZ